MVDGKRESGELGLNLGKRVAARRKSLGWTQDELAERMSVDAETISRFERGAHLPSLPTLERLANALRLEIGELLSTTELGETDDLAALAAWMEGLSPEDRKFVLAVARNCCEHLRNSSSRNAPRFSPSTAPFSGQKS